MAPIRTPVKTLRSGSLVVKVSFEDMQEEIGCLYEEVNYLKKNLNKKWEKIRELQRKIKEEEIRKDERSKIKARRASKILAKEIQSDEDDDMTDRILFKSASEHLNELCNNL